MWAVFTNPSGWPDHMRVRDTAMLIKRMDKLAARGHPIKILSIHFSVKETWQAMLAAQAQFKRERYGCIVVERRESLRRFDSAPLT